MQRNLILAVHGFLGQQEDWIPVQNALDISLKKETKWIIPDLFSAQAMPIFSYDLFIEKLIHKYDDAFSKAAKKVFLGYSLGGRLGLHILKKHSHYFDHFIFLSTHPGLQSNQEKEQRRAMDLQWSSEITDSHWDQFLAKWNSQSVFQLSLHEPQRLKSNYDLEKLRSSLDNWSLAIQEDLRLEIKKYQNKITWVIGQQDKKFLHLAEDLKQKKILLNFNRIFSGHRILFENPRAVSELLHKLL